MGDGMNAECRISNNAECEMRNAELTGRSLSTSLEPSDRTSTCVPRFDFRAPRFVIDAHVHFWDPAELDYPWLAGLPSIRRAFLPPDYVAATREGGGPLPQVVFVEANCRPEQARREVLLVERLAQERHPCIAGIVAFVDVAEPDGAGLDRALDALSCSPTVKGIRHNIQGHPTGFSLQRAFVEGVQRVGRSGLTFDLCVTHDQLPEVCDLVGRCPETQFALDHCGKPAIRRGLGALDPWRTDLARLAAHENVCCKLSGLLTEAEPAGWREEELIPYAASVVECFGTERVMYGSDWPVLTLAGRYRDWYEFTDRFTARWSAAERSGFFADNAKRVYRL
jgi:L-fuconolactonase